MFRIKRSVSNIVDKVKDALGYFGDNSNLHGMHRVLSLKPKPLYQRVFWFLILVASGVCASEILLQVLSLYSGGAVSYLIETDYLEFDTPFPAVTICEQHTSSGSADRVKSYVSSKKIPTTQILLLKDVVYWHQKFCKACDQCLQDQSCLDDFADPIKEIRAKCDQLLTDCWWDSQPFKCCERFLPLQSEYGVCFTFNSRLTGNERTLSVNRKTGLPALVFSATEEVGIRVHSPDDMVSVGMENIFGRPVILPLITDFEVILKVDETVSDKSVRSMPPSVRGCLFKEERPSFARAWPGRRYSFSTCTLYCRALSQLDQCNCTHPLMPNMGGMPHCNDIYGLKCVTNIKATLGSATCGCPMSCEEITYKVIHTFQYRHSGKPSPELVKRGTRGQVRLAHLPTSRIRRTAIRHTMGLVVDIGGVGGVFFGASLLSVIEIAYLCCIRTKK